MSCRSIHIAVSLATLSLALYAVPAFSQVTLPAGPTTPPPPPASGSPPTPGPSPHHDPATPKGAKGVTTHHDGTSNHPGTNEPAPPAPVNPGGGLTPPDQDHRHEHPSGFIPQPVLIVNSPGYYLPSPPVFGPVGGGLMLPPPPINPGFVDPPKRAPARPDPAKAEGLVTIGDRLFRAGNIKRAAERYEQARKANLKAAKPRVRLAQVALTKGDYKAAAELLRGAMTAEPGWLVNADDIQAIYGEPGDFAKMIAKLETHLQANPRDRDGWLVLGAELFLSGKTRQAGDVFARLNDRKPDPTLAAFLDATTPDAPPGR